MTDTQSERSFTIYRAAGEIIRKEVGAITAKLSLFLAPLRKLHKLLPSPSEPRESWRPPVPPKDEQVPKPSKDRAIYTPSPYLDGPPAYRLSWFSTYSERGSIHSEKVVTVHPGRATIHSNRASIHSAHTASTPLPPALPSSATTRDTTRTKRETAYTTRTVGSSILQI